MPSVILNKRAINSNVLGEEHTYSSTPGTDAFGRTRISAPFGLFDNKFLSSKNRHLWDERIEGGIISYSGLTGTFSVGQTVTGVTSLASGVITATAVGSFTYSSSNNEFTIGENLSTATGLAVLTAKSGADIEFDYYGASVKLILGTAIGEKVIRQTFRYFPYISGFSQSINTTQVFNAPKVGLKQTVIYGDSLNGIGMVIDGLTTKLLIRTNTSGTTSDATAAAQVDWNLDNMSGKGPEYGNPSGILLDITKNQIQTIDFQWLGIGRVRIGLNIDGFTYYVHEFEHANITTGVYMRTPSLPIRYEIENTGVTASSSMLRQVCCSIASEGGYAIPGLEFSVSHGIGERTLAAGVRTPLMAIRLKNLTENGNLPCRTTIKLVNIGVYARAADIYFELIHAHINSNFIGTWVYRDNSSDVLFSKDITAVTTLHPHEIESEVVPTGGSTQAAGATVIDPAVINNHIYLSQNIEGTSSDMFIIYGTSRAGTGYASTRITWIETE